MPRSIERNAFPWRSVLLNLLLKTSSGIDWLRQSRAQHELGLVMNCLSINFIRHAAAFLKLATSLTANQYL